MEYQFQNLNQNLSFLSSSFLSSYTGGPSYQSLEMINPIDLSEYEIFEPFTPKRYQAGEGEIEVINSFDINQHLIENTNTVFTMRVNTHFLSTLGIFFGDLLLVERNSSPRHGTIVVGRWEDELWVRRFCIEYRKVYLSYDGRPGEDIILNSRHDFELLGVVKHIIHSV